jgi:hypothetical protein
MNSSTNGSLSGAPNGRIIEFEIAELKKLPFQDSMYLCVRGRMPPGDFDVILTPRIYRDRPEYWGIEVTVVPAAIDAKDQGIGGVAIKEAGTMFERSVPLTGVTGSRGITVIGANQIKRIEITGESF